MQYDLQARECVAGSQLDMRVDGKMCKICLKVSIDREYDPW